MRVTLNGETRELRDGATVAELLDGLGLAQRRIAIEINRAVVAREEYARRCLSSDDVVEILHFIGGG